MTPPQQPPVPQVPFQLPQKPKKENPSITVKLLVIALLVLILVVPWGLLQWLIYDRQNMNEEAVNEVSQKWSNPQNVSGPVLYVPFIATSSGGSDYTAYLKVLPEELSISGKVVPEKRYRGIYEVVVYSSALSVTGKMKIPDYEEMKIDAKKIMWDRAFVGIGVDDMRGIRDGVNFKWRDASYSCNPGISTGTDGYSSSTGVSCPVAFAHTDTVPGAEIPFSFDLDLDGSKNLNFEPLGKTTKVHLTSTWASPSFSGAFLPDTHNINTNGFVADWKVLHLNRNYPQAWVDNAYNTADSRFGVELMVPVDHYTKSSRASKYAIMLIGLTFLIYFFVEVMQKLRIHPFQYILVGLSICVFYLLLLSFSEHMVFNFAYWTAASLTLLAITSYSGAIFRKKLPTAVMGTSLLLMYGFMFVIIQLEDYALLVGSVALFLILIVLMYLSRKIKWYGDDENNPTSTT
ncbi:MAG TPA: cell envelope integrity protein CreD [Bacteroidia bacterium]|nr:cell envelope integrity protein CreD [Bacteroidia bacterium]